MIAMTKIAGAEIVIAMIAVIKRAGHTDVFLKGVGLESVVYREIMSLPTPLTPWIVVPLAW